MTRRRLLLLLLLLRGHDPALAAIPNNRREGLIPEQGVWRGATLGAQFRDGSGGSADAVAAFVSDLKRDLKEAASHGTLGVRPCSPSTMFDDVFKELPPHLRRQRQEAGL